MILRKAYAYIVMDSKSIGSDMSFAWPTNEVAVMGDEGAANIIFRRELATATDPERRPAELIADYAGRLMTPWVAAERGLVDEVIDPRSTREVLVRALAMLRSKRRPAGSQARENAAVSVAPAAEPVTAAAVPVP